MLVPRPELGRGLLGGANAAPLRARELVGVGACHLDQATGSFLAFSVSRSLTMCPPRASLLFNTFFLPPEPVNKKVIVIFNANTCTTICNWGLILKETDMQEHKQDTSTLHYKQAK
jgi:hypothetical protein